MDFWPIALPERYAAVPDYGKITANSLAGKWEHINLKYDYGKQDRSAELVLKKDGTMSGTLTGKWRYNADKKQLMPGDVIVCVERELDRENSPRNVTFVYAGTEKSLNATCWGNKISN